jgi:glucose/mannose-6-phosphate isomerase
MTVAGDGGVLPGVGERVDTVGMWGLTAGLPEQVQAAQMLAAGVGHLPDAADVDSVVVLGMGGSGIAGDVLTAIAAPELRVPVVAVKGYEAPAFVGPGTLCFAVSMSGGTEETIEAAGGAAAAGAHMVVLSSGGRLAELAAEWGAPWVPLPKNIPMPRAGIGAVAVPPLMILEQMGLLTGMTDRITAAVTQLKKRRDQLIAPENPALDLARRIDRTMPIIYGTGAVGGVAAVRWKNQVNENAKAPAFAHTHPELCHNEICGWGQHGDVTRQVLTLVQLRHDFEHPQVGRRVELVKEIVDEVVASVQEVRAEGDGVLAQLFDLVLFGDFASLHLAYEVGVDPGPIPVLDEIKRRLAE